MSVAEFPSQPVQEFERTPPQDITAEQCVLGGMLLSKDAIADVVEVLREKDFYRPAHASVYDAVLDLYGRGEPADPVTVAAELTRRGELNRIGGAPYLHTLISSVPTAANAGYYARIVRERAILRRLVEAGTRIVQLGYAGDGGDVDDVVDAAQAEVYNVTDSRTSEDYRPLSEIMQGALDEIEAIGSRNGEMVGVPTGFADLDQLTNGLHPGQMIIIAARPAIGKCLAAHTRVLEAKSGELLPIAELVRRGRAGDDVFVRTLGEDGVFHDVRPSDFLHNGHRDVLRLTTAAGRALVATPNHPLLTPQGWTALESLQVGSRIAAPAQDGPGAAWDEVVGVERHGAADVYDLTVDGTHNFVAEGLVVHNSTLGLDLVRAASVKHGLASVIFSLEMGRNEITMRLLSAEARVALHHMRSGTMTDEDWTRLARRMSEVAEAPIFIDDSPNMTMMEIRAKCRRLKQRHDLRLVVVDYLQLMSSGKRVESRQQEVSEFSRSLKLLAKELEVPVIAIAQLNRGPEQRTDKKPMLSDLRESGCLTADTRVLRADTGAEVTMGELLESGERDIPVWSLDDRLRLVPRTMSHVFSSGTKEVFELRLTSGRVVKASANHPFLTYDGWTALENLKPGDRLAVPRHVPAPLHEKAWDEDEIVLLAHLLGDGSFVKRQPIRYASIDEANLAAVSEAAKRRFGITAIRDEYAAARVTTLRLPAPYGLTHGKRNPIAQWLDGLGLFGLRSHEKFVPDSVFSLPKEQLALFLHHLWATDGAAYWHRAQCRGIVYYASTSRRMIDDIARLLLRLNINARVKAPPSRSSRTCYQLHIMDVENQLRFLDKIGVHGDRGVSAQDVATRLRSAKQRVRLDTIPADVWDTVGEILDSRRMSKRELAAATGLRARGGALWTKAPGRATVGRVAAALDSAELDMLATNDVYWDSVASIASLGEQEVYDATVLSAHNFIADGICVHNSLEQDADMVILLHREDAYEKESPRAGEADLIVAKHRNGPTATITVAFQGHYSRFVDMAQG